MVHPVFDTHAFHLYATITIVSALLMLVQNWHAFLRMVISRTGYQDPVDLLPGFLNPDPKLNQMEPGDYVDRARRVAQDNYAVMPVFWVIGFLFVLVHPEDVLSEVTLGGFVAARLTLAWATYTKQRLEVRGVLYALSTMILFFMAIYTLFEHLHPAYHA